MSEPNNNIGLLKVRQADEESQTLVVQILEDAVSKSYEGLQVFFCARIGQTAGLGIIEQKLNPDEMTDPKNGKLEYTFRAEDWQVLGRQNAYFSFRKMTDDHTYVQQFSTRDLTYEVTKSIYSDGIKEVTKDGSTYVWTFEDLLRLLEEFKESGESDFLAWYEEIKGQLSEDAAGNLMILYQSLRDKTGKDADFRYFESDKSFMTRVFNDNAERGVNPLWFGAKGDGVADDGPALKATHEFANEHNYPVYYPNKTYYVSNAEYIPIKTNVDFGNSTILIEDKPNELSQDSNVFVVDENKAPVVHNRDSFLEVIKTKFKKNLIDPISELKSDNVRLLEIYDEDYRMYQRYGINTSPLTQPMTDIVKVDENGTLITPLTYDFDNVTLMVIHEIPKEKLIVKNGNFVSVGNNTGSQTGYDPYNRNILIKRSNVLIDNINHSIEDFVGKKPSRGFIRTEKCCDIKYANSKLQPRKYYSYTSSGKVIAGGTYEIANWLTLDLILENIDAYSQKEDLWGAHVGYFMKNLTVKNSKLNRIDSHYPSDTILIEDSQIGRYGLSLVGFGDLTIRNVDFVSEGIVRLRDDYGSFWNGNISIESVTHTPLNDTPYLFKVSPHHEWDFGLTTKFIKDYLRVKDFIVLDNGRNILDYEILLFESNSASSSLPARDYFRLGKLFSFENLKRDTKGGFRLLSLGNNYANIRTDDAGSFAKDSNGVITITPNIKFEVSNVRLAYKNMQYVDSNSNKYVSNILYPLNEAYNYNTVIESYGNNHLIPHYAITDCQDVYASVRGLKAKIDIIRSEVITLCNYFSGGTNAKVSIYNSEIRPRIKTGITNTQLIRGSKGNLSLIDCFLKNPKWDTGATMTSGNSDFAKVYEIFGGLFLDDYIHVYADFVNCQFDADFNPVNFNQFFDRYGIDIHNASGEYQRRYGTTAGRPPVSRAKQGDIYFDFEVSKLIVFDGTIWRVPN